MRSSARTIEAFADRWAAQPLFAGTPPEAARVWREDLLRNDPADLAAVLRGIGTGAMEPLWDRLGELTMPDDASSPGERTRSSSRSASGWRRRIPGADARGRPGRRPRRCRARRREALAATSLARPRPA